MIRGSGALPGTFVNSAVRTILVESQPSGAQLLLRGEPIGVTPCSVETSLLVATEQGGDFALTLSRDGVVEPIIAYALHYEAALVHVLVDPTDVPATLRSRDLWLFLVAR